MGNRSRRVLMCALLIALLTTPTVAVAKARGTSLPIEDAVLTFAPDVRPTIVRKHPAIVRATLQGGMKEMPISGQVVYLFGHSTTTCQDR